MFLKIAILTLTATLAPAATPDFTLRDAKGHTVTLSRYRGKVVILDFWATWCHGCKTEIPWFIDFAKHYKHRGLAVVGVAMDEEGWKSVKPYLREHPINYAIVAGSETLAKQFGVENLPVTLLIDRAGNIVDSHEGVIDKDAWESRIRDLLHERPGR